MVGSSYSAEDIAMQTVKYGAKEVICTYRKQPMGFNWPEQISERPLLTHVDGKTVHFSDGSSAEVDAIIFCTGYLHHYPYMNEDLRLRSPNTMYPHNLYKGVVYTAGGNGKVMYVGAQDQAYTFTMFDSTALWAVKCMLGDIALPPTDEMTADWKQWIERLNACKDVHEVIDFQTDYVLRQCKEAGYQGNLDVADIFHTWAEHKVEDILTYRDRSFASKFTGTQSPIHHSTFMSALDDSMQCFMGNE